MLPTVTIAILQVALISRMVRREMVGRLRARPTSPSARSRGVSERELIWRYALRNSAIPVLTALGTRFASMLNGVVLVEVVFAWPGVGSLVVRALDTRDYPLIQATVLVTAVLAILVQLLVDLCYPLLDPRVRLGKGASNDRQPSSMPPSKPRPSAVTARDFARAGATRRARDSRVKIWVGIICALVVILPVALARVLPLASPDATDLAKRRLPPLTDRPPVRHRPARP